MWSPSPIPEVSSRLRGWETFLPRPTAHPHPKLALVPSARTCPRTRLRGGRVSWEVTGLALGALGCVFSAG